MAFRARRVDPEKFINSSLYKLILSRIMASMGAARRKFGVTRYVAEQDPPVSAQYFRAPLAGLFFWCGRCVLLVRRQWGALPH